MYFLNSLLSKKKKKKILANCCGIRGVKHFGIFCYWKTINSGCMTSPAIDFCPITAPSEACQWKTNVPHAIPVTAAHTGDTQATSKGAAQDLARACVDYQCRDEVIKITNPCLLAILSTKKKTKQKQTPFSHSSLQALIVFSLVTLNALPFYQLSQDPSSSIRLIYLRG